MQWSKTNHSENASVHWDEHLNSVQLWSFQLWGRSKALHSGYKPDEHPSSTQLKHQNHSPVLEIMLFSNQGYKHNSLASSNRPHISPAYFAWNFPSRLCNQPLIWSRDCCYSSHESFDCQGSRVKIYQQVGSILDYNRHLLISAHQKVCLGRSCGMMVEVCHFCIGAQIMFG